MATSYTSLLGLALPVTGELAGTWGDTVNNAITSLLDTAIAGTTTLSTDADVTLTTTTGATNQARQAILLCSGARTAQRTITAPAQSKIYVVINNTTGGFAVKLVGAGPTTGVTVANGKTAVLVWNGSDFVEVAPATATTATNLAGGAAGSLPYQSGAGATTFLSIGTANRVLTSSGTAPQWSNSLTGLASIVSTGNISGTSLTIHPTLNGKIGANTAWIGENSTATVAIGMYQTGSGFTNIANVNFISGGSLIRGVISCTEESGGDAAYLAFSTRNAAASVGERMRITSAGNVGIGTAGPTSPLTIGTATSIPLLINGQTTGASYISITNTGGTYVAGLNNSAGSAIGSGLAYSTLVGSNSATALQLTTNGNARLTIDSAGNVGIGTTSPGARLDVTSAAAFMARFSGPANSYVDVTDGTGTFRAQLLSNTPFLTSIGAYGFILGTNNTERMRIDSNGNVGIGTTSPQAKLHVAGSGAQARFEVTTAADARHEYYRNSVREAYLSWDANILSLAATQASGVMTFATGGTTERMRIDSSGNVGIGIVPQVKFQIANGQTNANAITSWTDTGGANNSYLALYNNTSAWVWATAKNGTGTTRPIRFAINDYGDATTGVSLALETSGNVGIGTTTPNTRLTVAASGSTPTEILRTTSTASAATYLALQAYNASSAAVTYASCGSIIEANTAGAHSGAFVINTVSAAAAAERLRIDSSGNVGIGTTAPVGNLQVSGTGGIRVTGGVGQNSYVFVGGVNASDQRLVITDVNNTESRLWGRNNVPMTFYTNDLERLRIDASGNVGIGTTSPVNKLQVNGSLGRNAPVTKTGNFTLAATENWIICNGTGTITVTLPAASSWTGREVMIKTIAAFTVVSVASDVVPLAGGAAGTAILAATAGKFATLVSDGTNWIIMQAN